MMRSSYLDNHPTRPSGRGAANRQKENTPQLFGREGEQARLRQLLDAAVGESGGLVLIGGEAGIGKTSLATSIAREARGRGIPVWVGHCYELAATPPYGPWVDSGIFDQRSEDVLSPPMPGVGSRTASSQAALFERMQEFLAGVVRQNPLVLILEDLHWSDPVRLELLRFASRNLYKLRILLVVTYRDDEVTRRSPRVKDDQKRERKCRPRKPEHVSSGSRSERSGSRAIRTTSRAGVEDRNAGLNPGRDTHRRAGVWWCCGHCRL